MHETRGVEELHGFEVIEGDPDVRGWEVVTRDGHRIGEVAELLADSEDRSTHYLEVRLDRLDEDEILNQADVASDRPPEMPARTMGEALVRDSLLDIENRMLADGQPGFSRGQRHALVPAGQAHFETERHQIRIDSMPVEAV